MQIIPAILSNIALGSYCDKVGHKVPILIPLFGQLFSALWFGIMSLKATANWPIYYILIQGFVYGMCGSYAMVSVCVLPGWEVDYEKRGEGSCHPLQPSPSCSIAFCLPPPPLPLPYSLLLSLSPPSSSPLFSPSSLFPLLYRCPSILLSLLPPPFIFFYPSSIILLPLLPLLPLLSPLSILLLPYSLFHHSLPSFPPISFHL